MTAETQVRTDVAAPGLTGLRTAAPRCRLVVVSGPRRGLERALDTPRFRIGKSDANDLVLDDSTVSRFHCEIVLDVHGWLLRDLGSTNGTLVDGTAVREVYLQPGSLLTVGHVEVKVRPDEGPPEVLPSESTRFGGVVGRSLPMRELFGLLERLSPSEATILIGGETGTGKDALARAIHEASPRKSRPFIVVDCGAVVGSLIESELFGHEKGAFTGASSMRQGAFELAEGGTLFLDEIGELPLDMQPKLLRALEQRAFRRVGGTREVKVDIRVVGASKRNLRMEVERGKFREDLYFRLAVVSVDLPPLRERREDIPAIIEELIAGLSARHPTATPITVSDSVIGTLMAHDWPGNVRELRNVLERAAYMARATGRSHIDVGDTPIGATVSRTVNGEAELVPGKSYRETKADWEDRFERRYVRWLLERHDGNVSAAAREADMDRKYLHKLAKKHSIK